MITKGYLMLFFTVLLCSCQSANSPNATTNPDCGGCAVKIPEILLITENIKMNTRCYYNQDDTHYFMVNSLFLEESTLFVNITANLYMNYSLIGNDYSATEVDNYASNLVLDKGHLINRKNMYKKYANSGLFDNDMQNVETFFCNQENSYSIAYDLSSYTYWNGGESIEEDYPHVPSLYISFILDAKLDNNHPYSYRRLLLSLNDSEIMDQIMEIID